MEMNVALVSLPSGGSQLIVSCLWRTFQSLWPSIVNHVRAFVNRIVTLWRILESSQGSYCMSKLHFLFFGLSRLAGWGWPWVGGFFKGDKLRGVGGPYGFESTVIRWKPPPTKYEAYWSRLKGAVAWQSCIFCFLALPSLLDYLLQYWSQDVWILLLCNVSLSNCISPFHFSSVDPRVLWFYFY